MRTPASPNPPVTLVGRERELDVLRAHIADALVGHGSLVLIGGEAGIGKTALAETVCREAAERGALVLIGRCYDLTETPPYGLWTELFKHYPSADDMPPLPPAFAERGTVGAVTSQAALFQQVEDFSREATKQRLLVLLLDDLHWADPASLELLRSLARSLSSLPILLLGTYRSDELSRRHPLYQLLPTLVREARAERLDLHALADDAVRAFVGGYGLDNADTSRLIAYLQARAEGNAFFLGELLRSLREQAVLRQGSAGWTLDDLSQAAVPPLLRQVIDGRVARLDDESQRLLTVAAIIGHAVPLAVWATVAQTDEDVVLTVAEQGLDARLLVEASEGEGVRFAHALIREALYEGTPAIRRRRVHRRVGEALADAANLDPDAVAYHFRAGEDDRALVWLVTAGERAEAAYAWLTAADRYEAALALLEHGERADARCVWLLLRLSILRRYGDLRRALAHADEAVAIAERLGIPLVTGVARQWAGYCRCVGGNFRDGLPLVEGAAELVATIPATDPGFGFTPQSRYLAGRPVWRRTVRAGWMLLAALGGQYTSVLTWRDWLVALEATLFLGHSGSVSGDPWHGLGYAWSALGQTEEAAAAFAQAVSRYRSSEHHAMVGMCSLGLLTTLVLIYQTDAIALRRRVVEEAAAALARAEETGLRVTGNLACLPLLVLEGEWAAARRLVIEAEPAMAEDHMGRSVLAASAGALAFGCGDDAMAWRIVGWCCPRGVETAPETAMYAPAVAAQRLAGALALRADDLPVAKGWLAAHDRWLEWSDAVLGQSEGQVLWARYHRQSGDTERAFECAQRALAHATEPRQPLALLAAHRLIGELATDAGQFDVARINLDASLTLADACATPYERALTLLACAAMHAAMQNDADAANALSEVRAICEPLGAKPALNRAAAIAARLTVAQPAAPTYPDGLTRREVEVLRLLASGRTSQEMADALFLSPRTIERHITGLYRKIGARGRADATAYALHHLLTPAPS